VSDDRATALRFHAQTGGSTLTAQQPELNVARVTLQALGAVLGGTQSLHTNAFDEALGLPTQRSARIALRTQQVIAHEAGVAATADPLGGSYFVESLTEAVESEAWRHLARIDALGGAVRAIEAGYQQGEIERAAYDHARAVDAGERVVVGVNRFVDDEQGLEGEGASVPAAAAADQEAAGHQIDRLTAWRAQRDPSAVDSALSDVTGAAGERANLLPPMREALRRGATLGEVSSALRHVFGTHQPGG
jgi:methylmalonyl-CoA mutase N-terminal domain/subunit